MAEKKTSAPKKTTKKSEITPAAKQPAAKSPNQRNLLIVGGLILIGLLVVYLLSQRQAASLAVYMPADTPLFAQVDLAEWNSAEMQAIVDAFQVASASGGEASLESFEQRFEIFGVDYEEDISPWLGSQVGLGILDFGAQNLAAVTSSNFQGKLLVVLESTNPAAAQTFIDKVIAKQEANGKSVTSSHHGGTVIVEFSSEFGAIALGSGVIFIANDTQTIQAALDLKPADALSALPGYRQSTADLAGGRVVTAFINMATLADQVSSLTPTVAPATLAMLESATFTLGASVVSQGIQLEYVMNFDEFQLPQASLEMLRAASGPLATIERYPEDVILFAGSKSSGLDPEMLRQNLGEDAYQDFVESMDAFGAMAGIDITNLLTALDGEISLGLFPQTTGIGGMTGGIGVQVMLTTSQDAALANFFASLSPLVEQQMQLAPQERTIANMHSYVIDVPFGGELLAYGSGSGLGFITTNPQGIEASADPDYNSFVDSDTYKDLQRFFGSAQLSFYMDVAGLLSLVETMGGSIDGMQAVKPLTAIAGASEPYQNGSLRGVIIAFIDR